MDKEKRKTLWRDIRNVLHAAAANTVVRALVGLLAALGAADLAQGLGALLPPGS